MSDKTTLHRDFKLVDVNGERHVSYIKNNEIHRCGSDDPQWLGLATEHGETKQLIGETKHHYRSAVWSSDGAKVAYELMGASRTRSSAPTSSTRSAASTSRTSPRRRPTGSSTACRSPTP